MNDVFAGLRAEIAVLSPLRRAGRVTAVSRGLVRIGGLGSAAGLGDGLEIRTATGRRAAEVVALAEDHVLALVAGPAEGIAVGDLVELFDDRGLAPDHGWLGRMIDPAGRPLDGRPLRRGPRARALRATPPAAAMRRALGPRLETGLCAFDTFLPLVRGQRIGLFAGAGVGKSMLLGDLARGVSADVAVIALIGERGRELRHFTDTVLGRDGMARSVVVAATSDQPALVRRRAGWTALAVAEHFRDAGRQVLLLMDSVTRFAEAHREIALTAGEAPSLGGYPPSVATEIAALAERAGPGPEGAGDITAVFSVLVPGADMEEPVADILRGTLDGHVVLDRAIAERGRFPAIDLLRSVSRALPGAATAAENALLTRARGLLGAHERAAMMVQAGLYAAGSDAQVDAALRAWPRLEAFLASAATGGIRESFAQLAGILAEAGGQGGSTAPVAGAGGGPRAAGR